MGRPKLPKSTKVSGQRWRVTPRRQVHLDGEPCEGVCHYDRHLIEVTVESDDEYTILRNFYHEVAHAVIYESGVELEENTEHAIINNLEKWLAANCDLRKTVRKPKPAKKPAAAPTDGPKQKKTRVTSGR